MEQVIDSNAQFGGIGGACVDELRVDVAEESAHSGVVSRARVEAYKSARSQAGPR